MCRLLKIVPFFFFLVCNALVSKNPYPQLRFHQSERTLTTIMNIIKQKKKGAYLRFGDGDVNLALGKADMKQTPNHLLQQEMREALGINGPNALKALPLHCKEFGGLEPGMFPGNHESNYELSSNLLTKVAPFWTQEFNNIYTPVALHFCATNHQTVCITFLRFLKQSKCILVGNQHIPQEIRSLLFGPDCAFVPTPEQNSYAQIDSIEQDCLKAVEAQQGNYTIIVTSMGCSGRVLQKRLWQKLDNVFLFDFGSLMDALCGWNTRAWIELSNFDAASFIAALRRDIRVVCTAALIDQQYEERKKEYVQSLNTLASYGYIPYIVESCSKQGKSFLNSHSPHVLYTRTNNTALCNKGVNEALSVVAACNSLPFKDDDIIIKLTGRYQLNSDALFKVIKKNPHIDAFIKVDAHGQVFTGCFALSYAHFKKAYATLNTTRMEHDMINIEHEIAQYIRTHIPAAKIMYLDSLDVTAAIFGTGERILTHW
jgi:hypothetical protein